MALNVRHASIISAYPAGLAGLFLSAASLTIGGVLGLTGEGRWWVLLGLYSFTICYSISLGALVWVLISDVFPTCHRAQAISIVSTAHFTTSATMVILLPVMVRSNIAVFGGWDIVIDR